MLFRSTLRETDKPPSISFPDNPPTLSTPLPYPQRFQKQKLDKQFSKFLDIFKKIHCQILEGHHFQEKKVGGVRNSEAF